MFADSSKFDGNLTTAPLQIPQIVKNYNFLGCFAQPGGRTLSLTSTTSNSMVLKMCATYCSGKTYFGLEFSAECYCGNSLNIQSTLADPSQCNMPCKGSNSEYCGGAGKMQVYQLATDVKSSTLTSLPDTSTVSSSTNGISSGSSIATKSTVSVSSSGQIKSTSVDNIVATSSATSIWSNALSSVNSLSSVTSTTSASFVSTTSSASRTQLSSTSSLVPASTSLASVTHAPSGYVRKLSDYQYQGCFVDGGARLLNDVSVSNSSVTNDLCAVFCKGYAFFGTEWARECYVRSDLLLSHNCNLSGKGICLHLINELK